MKRRRDELDRPGWSLGRRLLDWADLREFMAGDEMTMSTEEYEDDDSVVVRVEMPGLDPERDVEITTSDRLLCIKAERRQQSKTQDKKGFRSEFRYGSFLRTVPLPHGVKNDVTASYDDGILEVRVSIDRAEAESRRIPITRVLT
jgi:HSP20 family protein